MIYRCLLTVDYLLISLYKLVVFIAFIFPQGGTYSFSRCNSEGLLFRYPITFKPLPIVLTADIGPAVFRSAAQPVDGSDSQFRFWAKRSDSSYFDSAGAFQFMAFGYAL